MYSFENDYCNGAHPLVLQRLIDTNDEQTGVYGFDKYSNHAKELIKEACQAPDAQVYFLTGGTQTNAVVIDSILQKHEGVVAVDSGHINAHEAGAIEYTGHKVIAIPSHEGRMDASELRAYLCGYFQDESRDHVVYPGMVYITFPTEYGTLYSAQQLNDIYAVCQEFQIPLFVDGARLGYGLTAPGNDITLPFLASHCDAFYIGGTKVGALCGEAVVFTHANGHRHFFSIQKQHGAVIAKGRLIGLQFEALFSPIDDSGELLYLSIARHANMMAEQMKQIFKEKGIPFYIDSPTNQQFVVLSNEHVARLSKDIIFSQWAPTDESHTICRFVTSWATRQEDIKDLASLL